MKTSFSKWTWDTVNKDWSNKKRSALNTFRVYSYQPRFILTFVCKIKIQNSTLNFNLCVHWIKKIV